LPPRADFAVSGMAMDGLTRLETVRSFLNISFLSQSRQGPGCSRSPFGCLAFNHRFHRFPPVAHAILFERLSEFTFAQSHFHFDVTVLKIFVGI